MGLGIIPDHHFDHVRQRAMLPFSGISEGILKCRLNSQIEGCGLAGGHLGVSGVVWVFLWSCLVF